LLIGPRLNKLKKELNYQETLTYKYLKKIKLIMSLKSLQEKIGTTADGAFGPGTLKAAMAYYKLTPERAAHFFAQTAHETGEFKLFTENLNYSADGLKKVFGKYFPGDLATSYAKNPQKIANRVYGSRMGNGDENSGDGFKFRGRGALQLTGKSNYEAFAKFLNNQEVIDNPDLVATVYAFESAMFFFERNKLWTLCDTVTDASILSVTKRINGGTNGLDHRSVLTKKYYKWLKG
jgi:putative chitinase